MEITHLDIRAAVRGATFPATGDDLVAVARVNQAPPETMEALDRLGAADEFDSVEEVLDELNLDHTAIDDTVQLRVALGMADDADAPDGLEDRTERYEDPAFLDEDDDDVDAGLEDEVGPRGMQGAF